MDREGFRNRLKQYKEARGLNPLLKYWEWKAQPAEKDIPKYDEGGEVGDNKAIPTQEEYIAEQIAAKKATALSNFRSATEPVLPIINGQPNVNSCIYTALNMYGKKYATPGNWTFYDDPGKHGFKQKELSKALPSDLIQVFDKNKPYHMMMLDGYDEQGHPLYNYSRGMKGDSSDIVKAKTNFPNTKKLAYEFVGTPADSTQWKNEYKKLYGYADGGEVTDPPTYKDWLKSLIKNDLWMHPDYYMTYSLNSAADALRLASAGLPGREATPPIPAPVEVKGEFPQEWTMNNLYSVENPKKKGVTKKYAKMYDSRTLGAGVDVVSGHPELYNKAKRFGIEKELADKIAYEHIVHDDLVIRDNYADIYGKAAADTLSFGPRFLVAQARYQLGNVRKGWDEIHNALAKGDAEALKKAVLKVTPEDHDYRKKWVKNFNVYGNEPE